MSEKLTPIERKIIKDICTKNGLVVPTFKTREELDMYKPEPVFQKTFEACKIAFWNVKINA